MRAICPRITSPRPAVRTTRSAIASRSAGHGKCGVAISRAVSPCTAAHNTSARARGSSSAPKVPASMQACTASAFGHLVHAVQACLGAGTFGADEGPRALGLVLWAAVHGITALPIAKPHFPWPADREAIADLVVRTAGLGLVMRGQLASMQSTPCLLYTSPSPRD